MHHARTSARYADSGTDPAVVPAVIIFVVVLALYLPSVVVVARASSTTGALLGGVFVAGVAISTAIGARAVGVARVNIALVIVSAFVARLLTTAVTRDADVTSAGADPSRGAGRG
ncbi:MAG: hypothetical protein R8F63_18470 [Acidimicrobiales bacterium]|nr:hypothetical protein [Acidimicrobiales bacterium]